MRQHSSLHAAGRKTFWDVPLGRSHDTVLIIDNWVKYLNQSYVNLYTCTTDMNFYFMGPVMGVLK